MLDGAATLFGLDQDRNEKLRLPAQEVKVNTGAAVISHRHFNRCRLHTHGTVVVVRVGVGGGVGGVREGEVQLQESGHSIRCPWIILQVSSL